MFMFIRSLRYRVGQAALAPARASDLWTPADISSLQLWKSCALPVGYGYQMLRPDSWPENEK
jgi:hypothetical protein